LIFGLADLEFRTGESRAGFDSGFFSELLNGEFYESENSSFFFDRHFGILCGQFDLLGFCFLNCCDCSPFSSFVHEVGIFVLFLLAASPFFYRS